MLSRRSLVVLLAALLLAVNIAIASKLFSVEYSAYLESNEGTFIAIARGVASHPGDLAWWPLWDCGMPFQNTYLPLLPVLVGAIARLTGLSPALIFHQACAVFFCLAPLAVFALALAMMHRPWPAFSGSLLFSLCSPSVWLVPAIRTDIGSWWNLRRLQIVAYYGEGPHTASMAFIPLAICFFYLAIQKRSLYAKILAGVFGAAAVLANAFAAVILALAGVCLLAVAGTQRLWRNAVMLAAIGLLAYLWISPFVPPSVLADIRMNSPTVDGDYRFTARSGVGAALLAAGFLLTAALTRRSGAALRFFLLFAFLMSGIVLLGTRAQIYVVPQPHRYQIAMDLGICLCLVLGGTAILDRCSIRARRAAAALLIAACAVQFHHVVNYAGRLIQSTDITQTPPYRIARWVDGHLQGRRVMISGSWSFHFNDFTDTPQLHGGHDPMLPNFVLRIATFVIYSGMNTGARDAEISTLWLKALGAHAVSVPGPGSLEFYKPFANPEKFEGVLPVLWREGGDTIYKVPSPSDSLAHVIPTDTAVRHAPVNGLDTAEIEQYVAALEEPSLPPAPLIWRSRHQAEIHTQVRTGQAVSVQVTHHPGWKAHVNGSPQAVERDGLGFLLLHPPCNGPCDITLTYDGGPEWRLTLLLSAGTSIAVLALIWIRRRRRQPGQAHDPLSSQPSRDARA